MPSGGLGHRPCPGQDGTMAASAGRRWHATPAWADDHRVLCCRADLVRPAERTAERQPDKRGKALLLSAPPHRPCPLRAAVRGRWPRSPVPRSAAACGGRAVCLDHGCVALACLERQHGPLIVRPSLSIQETWRRSLPSSPAQGTAAITPMARCDTVLPWRQQVPSEAFSVRCTARSVPYSRWRGVTWRGSWMHSPSTRSCRHAKRAGGPAACGGECGLVGGGALPSATGRVGVCHGGMVLRRTPHAVDETLDPLVWSPQDRRDVWHGEGHQRLQERSTARVQRVMISK